MDISEVMLRFNDTKPGGSTPIRLWKSFERNYYRRWIVEDQKFEVGERVWYQPLGWGVVDRIDKGEVYVVRVCFSGLYSAWFTEAGEFFRGSGIQSLFRANSGVLKFDTTELPDWPKDHPIWVRNSDVDNWLPRHFDHFAEGKVFCYYNGSTSHSDGLKIKWKYYTDVDPNKK